PRLGAPYPHHRQRAPGRQRRSLRAARSRHSRQTPDLTERTLGRQVDWKVRACSSLEELRAAVSPIWHYFGRTEPTEAQIAPLARVLPAERVHAVWDGERAIGGAGAFPFVMTVPGGRVAAAVGAGGRRSGGAAAFPCVMTVPGGRIAAAGVTVVGVLPTHRRRGVLRSM